MKIEQLTPEQQVKMQEVKNFWIDYINSCKHSVDRGKAKIGIDWLYGLTNRKGPIIVHMESPMAAQYAVHYIKQLNEALPQIFSKAQVWDQVGDQVWAQVRDQVWDQVRDQVGAQKINFSSFAAHGSIRDFGWVSFYDFFTQIGVINHGGFNEFKSILTSGIYDMVQLNGYCIVSNMPSKITRDERNRLHNADGSAIEFRDGYAQYYWHGVAVPANWILSPETITKETLIKERNAEKRRCIMEILGESKYALLLDLETVEVDQYNGQEVALMKTIKEDDLAGEFVYFIKVICNSTLRNYYLCVPLEAFKLGALGALAWTFGMQTNEYKLLIET